MILYTMMPQEFIFQTAESEYKKQRVVDYKGVQVLVEETPEKEYQVIRLLSTNPNDFLSEEYTPGKKIKINPS